MKTKLLALLAMATLVACGSKLDGTYKGNHLTLTFKSNGTVQFDEMYESKYEIEDKTVKFDAPSGGKVLLKILEDGTLDLAGQDRLKKQK